ncbi:Uncharacterised protein [Vibrio cholerae]|nr:Uncharacterised protein [Vibrio cholerae]
MEFMFDISRTLSEIRLKDAISARCFNLEYL